jgi:hypothetical protein
MNLKSIALAGATLLTLAAPAAAVAQPYWGHDRGDYDRRWRDRDDWRRSEWRDDWRHGYGPRCVIENRSFYNWRGQYVYNPVRVCR